MNSQTVIIKMLKTSKRNWEKNNNNYYQRHTLTHTHTYTVNAKKEHSKTCRKLVAQVECRKKNKPIRQVKCLNAFCAHYAIIIVFCVIFFSSSVFWRFDSFILFFLLIWIFFVAFFPFSRNEFLFEMFIHV